MKENGTVFGSDFAKIDAHVIQPEEFEELPMLTEEMLARGVWKRNGKVIGRPKLEAPKQRIAIRISPDVAAYFRATGKGWQTRMDVALSEWIREHG
jgi:uncharacterized protein (DUF4415 family)